MSFKITTDGTATGTNIEFNGEPFLLSSLDIVFRPGEEVKMICEAYVKDLQGAFVRDSNQDLDTEPLTFFGCSQEEHEFLLKRRAAK